MVLVRDTLVITVTVMVVLFGANSVLYLFFSAPKSSESGWEAVRIREAKSLGIEYDKRSRWQVFSDCQPACAPLFNPLEELGVDNRRLIIAPFPKNKKAIYCNESGRWVVMQNDQYGFRNNRSESYKKTDVVLIGDSFAAGACVDDGETIADRIRQWSSIDVLNLGVGGQQPLGELAVLKEYLPEASTLVWMFFEGNDYSLAERNSEFLLQYLVGGYTQNDKAYNSEAEQRLSDYLNSRRTDIAEEKTQRTVNEGVSYLNEKIADYFSLLPRC